MTPEVVRSPRAKRKICRLANLHVPLPSFAFYRGMGSESR